VVVRDDGRIGALGQRVSRLSRARSWTAWSARSAMAGSRKRALVAFRRLPPPAKDAIRGAFGRLRA
jgi:hypothetical protein